MNNFRSDSNGNLTDIKEKLNSRELYKWMERMKRASIIIPLIDINEEVYILFQVRAKKLKSQPGDVCFSLQAR